MDDLLQDLRYALRSLRKSPGFALVALLTLALGIGANTAVFSVVNTVLLRPLPYPEADRLLMLWGTYPGFGRTTTSLPDFLDWREQASSFENLAGFDQLGSNLALPGGEAARVNRMMVTANFFETIGARPAAGRFFAPEEERGGSEMLSLAAPVAVVSHRFWQTHFAGDPGAIGTDIQLHGRPFTVIGVAPPDFRFGADADVWTPLNLEFEAGRRNEVLGVVGRLRPGATVEQAQAEMQAINRRLAEEYPQTNSTIGVEVLPLHEQVLAGARPALLAFLGAVALVLLIVCANVANLMLTRAAGREREMAIRSALGAGRGRIARQLITESVVLAFVGAALGLLLAIGGIHLLREAQAELIPRFHEVGIDLRVLGFTAGLAVLTGVLFGLLPARQLLRGTSSAALRGGRGAIGGRRVNRLRGALVLGEVALALVLLVGAGLLLRSFDRLQRVDVGFEPAGVMAGRLSLPAAHYPELAQRVAFFDQLLAQLQAAPGVELAALGSNVPLSGGAGYWSFSIDGIPEDPAVMQDAQPFSVTPDYFRMLGIPLLAGRRFTEADHADAAPVAIINRTLAQRFFGELDPVGRRFTFGNPENPETQWWTIVGVVGDTRVSGMSDAPYSQIYRPFAQAGVTSPVMLVRGSGDPRRLTATLQRAVREQDATVPVYDLRSMEQYVADAVAQPRVGTLLSTAFALAALLLAALGIYGLIAYTVAQRTREIGVCMALGAEPGAVLRETVARGVRPAFAGIAIGLFGAWAAARLIENLLFAVGPLDVPTFVGVPALLAGVALLAAYLPARRAARVDPMVALRAE